jgi:multidrug efflux pump
VLELDPQIQLDTGALGDLYLYVRSAAGQLVPLGTLARVEESVAPITINHQAPFPSVTLSFNLSPTISRGFHSDGSVGFSAGGPLLARGSGTAAK